MMANPAPMMTASSSQCRGRTFRHRSLDAVAGAAAGVARAAPGAGAPGQRRQEARREADHQHHRFLLGPGLQVAVAGHLQS